MGSSTASAENFCLRWNDFESNVSVAFRDLRNEEDFFDVTLACDDTSGQGRTLRAHKVILSACSNFMKQLLRSCAAAGQTNPMIYLRGVKLADMEAVLDFIYHGEVNVAQDELNSFLAVAEDLQIKGLTQTTSTNNKSGHKERSKGGGMGSAKKMPSSNVLAGQPALKKVKKQETNSEDLKEIKSEPSSSALDHSGILGSEGMDPGSSAVTSDDPTATFDDGSQNVAGEGPSGFGDEQFEDEDSFGAFGDADGADNSLLEPEMGGAEGQDSTKGRS